MFRLWCLVEDDLLADGASYRLTNTGQGLQRVQAAPRASRAMHGLVSRVQARLGSWVGSSVVHMGDHNVPNGLLFISKYCQVPQILNPVGLAIDALPAAARADPHLASYVDAVFGSNPAAATAILADFFRPVFVGSGGGGCFEARTLAPWHPSPPLGHGRANAFRPIAVPPQHPTPNPPPPSGTRSTAPVPTTFSTQVRASTAASRPPGTGAAKSRRRRTTTCSRCAASPGLTASGRTDLARLAGRVGRRRPTRLLPCDLQPDTHHRETHPHTRAPFLGRPPHADLRPRLFPAADGACAAPRTTLPCHRATTDAAACPPLGRKELYDRMMAQGPACSVQRRERQRRGKASPSCGGRGAARLRQKLACAPGNVALFGPGQPHARPPRAVRRGACPGDGGQVDAASGVSHPGGWRSAPAGGPGALARARPPTASLSPLTLHPTSSPFPAPTTPMRARRRLARPHRRTGSPPDGTQRRRAEGMGAGRPGAGAVGVGCVVQRWVEARGSGHEKACNDQHDFVAGPAPPFPRPTLQVGTGRAAYRKARTAVRSWAHADVGWVTTNRPPLNPGAKLCIAARALGPWPPASPWMANPLRVAYVGDERRRAPGEAQAFALAATTLGGHALAGEERFRVALRDDGSVWYEVYSFARPATLASALTYPLVAALQRQFRRDSAAAVARAVAGG